MSPAKTDDPTKAPWWIAELVPVHGAGWSVTTTPGRAWTEGRPVPSAMAVVRLAVLAWREALRHLAAGMPAVVWRFRSSEGYLVVFVQANGEIDVAGFDHEEHAAAMAEDLSSILAEGGLRVVPLVEAGVPLSKDGQA